jgi:hypothetical protein
VNIQDRAQAEIVVIVLAVGTRTDQVSKHEIFLIENVLQSMLNVS